MAEKTPNKKSLKLPSTAIFREQDHIWEWGFTDSFNKKQGLFKYWRENGQIQRECFFENNILHGVFFRYHPNGEISQEGYYREGVLDGDLWLYRSSENTDERFIQQVSSLVVSVQIQYQRGNKLNTQLFNKDGQRVTKNGENYPDRPASVPPSAEYNEDSNIFTNTIRENQEFLAESKSWYATGEMYMYKKYANGLLNGESVTYLKNGTVYESYTYQDGVKHGSYTRALEEVNCLVKDSHQISGYYDHNELIGKHSFKDRKNLNVRSVDLGCLDHPQKIWEVVQWLETTSVLNITEFRQQWETDSYPLRKLILSIHSSFQSKSSWAFIQFLNSHCLPLCPPEAENSMYTMLSAMPISSDMNISALLCSNYLFRYLSTIIQGSRPDELLITLGTILQTALLPKNARAFKHVGMWLSAQPDNLENTNVTPMLRDQV